MPFITATQIHDGKTLLPAGTTIEVSEDGTILNIIAEPTADTIYYEGMLAPGFVNVHCHLELSHMKGVVPEHTGLIPFLETIPLSRNKYTEEQKTEARHAAYNELLQNGVVAVGDIANTTDTIDIRELDKLNIYTFVESIGFTEANAERSFGYGVSTYNAFAGQEEQQKKLQQTIVPHAPYSVSPALFRLIDGHQPGAPISIHNQESEEENRFYQTKEGGVLRLLSTLGIDPASFIPTGKTSLYSYMEWLSPDHPFILVHNTCSTREDVQYAEKRIKELYWCLCPNANLYIENKLPDVAMLMDEEAMICIGTDSLASNHQLSVLAELQTINQHYPNISWENLITWGTYNGAAALQMKEHIGNIATGKKPGILLLTGMDTQPSITVLYNA